MPDRVLSTSGALNSNNKQNQLLKTPESLTKTPSGPRSANKENLKNQSAHFSTTPKIISGGTCERKASTSAPLNGI